MNKKLRNLFAGFLATAMLITPLPVMAQSSDSIRNQMNSLQQEKKAMEDKISGLKGQITENSNRMEELVAQKSNLEQQITLLYGQIENLNQQIEGYNALIIQQQKDLVEAQQRLDRLRVKNKERIRVMEEQGKLSYWSVIFEARDFSDLLDQLSIVGEIARSDRQRLKEMSEAAEQVEQGKKDLQAEKEALEQTQKELDEKKQELDSKNEEVSAMLQELTAMGEQYQQLLMDAESRTNDLMHSLTQKEKEYQDAKDREYQQWLEQQKPTQPPEPETKPTVPDTTKPTTPDTTKPTTPEETPKPTEPPKEPDKPSGNNSTWLVPIAYSYVSSPFGYRFHPIYHQWRLHAGIDLAAPQGTPIVASRSGVVTTASYEAGGAGNYVNINHMDGYVSRYMHMTHYVVSPGQKVSAGQVIGYCGATGAAEGPHLHFGIYENGTPIDPAPFIIG